MSCISGMLILGKLWRSRMLQPASFLESLYLVVFEARLQCGKLKKCLLWVCVIFMGMLCFLTGAATVNERLEQRTLKKKQLWNVSRVFYNRALVSNYEAHSKRLECLGLCLVMCNSDFFDEKMVYGLQMGL